MPKLTQSAPKYRKHRRSGQAVATLSGVDHYLGPHGTKVSKMEYDRVVCEWLANGRHLPQAPEKEGVTVAELIARYWVFAREYYRKDGEPTGSLADIRGALRPLKGLYGRTPAGDFGPLALRAVQQKMVGEGVARCSVNKRIGAIKRVFKWGVARELVPPGLSHGLQAAIFWGRIILHDEGGWAGELHSV